MLEMKPNAGDILKLGDLAPIYANHISEHIKSADRQGTSSSSKFLDGCRKFNSGEITQNELVELTMKYGFVNVIDAFHVVGQSDISKRFYLDERKENGGIRITDEFTEMIERTQSTSLRLEVDGRWRLVERAWELGVSKSLISIDYDSDTEKLFSVDAQNRRKSVTSCRNALNGYQKGKCFYCASDIDINYSSSLFPEVDHFFPHTLKKQGFGGIVDGVWNLVLACMKCNRGVGGKFDRVPTIPLLERLHSRNEFLITSHDPLRETLIGQTGASTKKRGAFLNDFHNKATARLIHTWEPAKEDKHPLQ
jgi:hypothetical protein